MEDGRWDQRSQQIAFLSKCLPGKSTYKTAARVGAGMGWERLTTLLTTSVGGSAPGRWAWLPTHKLTSAGLQRKVQLRISDIQLKEFHICRKNSFSVPFLAWDVSNGCFTDYLRDSSRSGLVTWTSGCWMPSLPVFLSYCSAVSAGICQHRLSIRTCAIVLPAEGLWKLNPRQQSCCAVRRTSTSVLD